MRGLVLGKFMPFHKGHEYLINFAAQKVDELTVLVCTLNKEPIDGQKRFDWVKLAFPTLNVIHFTDEIPSAPEEHLDFWNIWKKAIKKYEPNPIDVVFTSENYGDKLAEILHAKHICVDLKRTKIPVSASLIRENPAENWQYISEQSRPYYVKKVVLFGSESTGKSTLTRLLAAHFKTQFIPEFARTYLNLKNSTSEIKNPNNQIVVAEDIQQIALGQLTSEIDACSQIGIAESRLLFCDTNLLVTKVYAIHYFGFCPNWIEERLAKVQNEYHYFLMNIDIPWVSDGQRDRSDKRKEMHQLFKNELLKRNLPFTEISGNFQKRFEVGVKAVEKILLAKRKK